MLDAFKDRLTCFALYPKAGRAFAAIGVALMIAVLADPLLCTLLSDDGGGSSGEGSASFYLGQAVQIDGASGISIDSDRVMTGFSNEPPDSFSEEVFAGQSGWYSSSKDGVIAGFAFPSSVSSSMKQVSSWFEQKGWRSVPSGQDSVRTFIKEQGDFRWAMVSCETVGNKVSVVVNARRCDD